MQPMLYLNLLCIPGSSQTPNPLHHPLTCWASMSVLCLTNKNSKAIAHVQINVFKALVLKRICAGRRGQMKDVYR